MATGVKAWSTTAGDNDDADSAINWLEGQAPSTVNDSSRAMMAAIAGWFAQIDGGTVSNGTVGGSASAITLTCDPTVTALAAGQRYAFKFGSTTTGATTLAIDGLSAGALQWRGAAIIAGDYAANEWCLAVCDGTNFQMMIPPRLSGAPTDFTTDSTGGAVADFVAFFDASQSNAANKVLVTDFFANVLANITAKATPVVADTLMLADSAASGAAKISTLAQVFQSFVNLTSKATPIGADSIAVIDSAASNAAKNVTLTNLIAAFIATQANQETGTSTATLVTPGRQHFHASAPKFWNYSIVSGGGVPTSPGDANYNMTSVTDTAAGRATFVIATDFSSAAWCCVFGVEEDSGAGEAWPMIETGTQAAGSVRLTNQSDSGTLSDPGAWHVAGSGDLA